MCSSGVGFDPFVAGTRYTFDVAGLYNGVFVMEDRQVGSVWTHYDGTVLTGPLTGEGIRLEIIPLIHTTWDDWVGTHPDGLVLDWYAEYADHYHDVKPGNAGLGPQFQETVLHWDDRLPRNELVLGVRSGATTKAYVLADLPHGLAVVADELGGTPVVILADADAGFALAYSPEINGDRLEFAAAPGGWATNDGSVWDSGGRAVSGPRAGSSLAFVTSFVTEWYGWVAYHPDTGIYDPGD